MRDTVLPSCCQLFHLLYRICLLQVIFVSFKKYKSEMNRLDTKHIFADWHESKLWVFCMLVYLILSMSVLFNAIFYATDSCLCIMLYVSYAGHWSFIIKVKTGQCPFFPLKLCMDQGPLWHHCISSLVFVIRNKEK